jgi:UPF0755 protein
MKDKIKIYLFLISDLFYIFLVSIVFYLTLHIKSNKIIYIPSGGVNSTVSYLSKNSYDINILDNYIIRLIGTPQKGWINFKSTTITKADFIYKLTKAKAATKIIKLLPGETYHFLLIQLSKELNLSINKLLSSYKKYRYKLDGNILAESYNIPIGMSENNVISFMINYSNKKHEEYSKKIFKKYNKKEWFKYIIIASIIQKESATIEEMPIISSVIYNRLKKGMRLQMDGTLNYGKYSHDKDLYKRIRSDNSSYNTYKVKGLPKNPICAVSFNSIKAAVNPKKTNYLFFVKKRYENSHIFSSNYTTHKLNIKKNKI